jgi:glutamate-1-semialdehyde 2,1-aminomutase
MTCPPVASGPGAASGRLHEAARQLIPGGTSRLHYHFDPYPIYARSGRGCRLEDVDGVERIDFLNNMTALIHGHAHPAVTAAISEQLVRGTAFSEPVEAEVELARTLVNRVASVERVRFLNSGTEAVMLSVKLARAFTGRQRIVKFEGAYHGYYDYVQISFGGGPPSWGPEDAPASVPTTAGLAATVSRDVLVARYNDRGSVERLFGRHGREIAALIVDPLSVRAGAPRPEPGYLEFLGEVAARHGALVIYDEVISFRLAHGGAQSRYGGRPDLTTFGKVIGGGLPVGALGGRADVMALLAPDAAPVKVLSGGTFSANPLTMAAGQAALDVLTPAAVERLNGLGDDLRRRGNEVFRRSRVPGQVTGDGSLFRIVLTSERVRDYRTSVQGAAPPGRMAQLHGRLLTHGVIVAKAGMGCLSTPMGQAEVDAFVAALADALEDR